MNAKWGRMSLRQEAPSSPTIVFELPGGAQGTFSFVPPELASELVKRWNAYEDRDAIPPREPTGLMVLAGMRARGKRIVIVSEIWRAMYDAAIAEKEGK